MMNNKHGSASVLVILVIIVLATFGGVAVTSSWTNKKLAMQTAAWTEEFYEQEAKAEYMTARIDAALLEAQQKALAYFTGNYFAEEKRPLGIAPSLISEEFTGWVQDDDKRSDRLIATRIIFRRLYYYYAVQSLSGLSAETGIEVTTTGGHVALFLDTGTAAPMTGDVIVSFTVSAGDRPGDIYLKASIDVLEPEYDLTITDAENWRYTMIFSPQNGSVRYSITNWSTRQVPITMPEHSAGSSFNGTVG